MGRRCARFAHNLPVLAKPENSPGLLAIVRVAAGGQRRRALVATTAACVAVAACDTRTSRAEPAWRVETVDATVACQVCAVYGSVFALWSDGTLLRASLGNDMRGGHADKEAVACAVAVDCIFACEVDASAAGASHAAVVFAASHSVVTPEPVMHSFKHGSIVLIPRCRKRPRLAVMAMALVSVFGGEGAGATVLLCASTAAVTAWDVTNEQNMRLLWTHAIDREMLFQEATSLAATADGGGLIFVGSADCAVHCFAFDTTRMQWRWSRATLGTPKRLDSCRSFCVAGSTQQIACVEHVTQAVDRPDARHCGLRRWVGCARETMPPAGDALFGRSCITVQLLPGVHDSEGSTLVRCRDVATGTPRVLTRVAGFVSAVCVSRTTSVPTCSTLGCTRWRSNSKVTVPTGDPHVVCGMRRRRGTIEQMVVLMGAHSAAHKGWIPCAQAAVAVVDVSALAAVTRYVTIPHMPLAMSIVTRQDLAFVTDAKGRAAVVALNAVRRWDATPVVCRASDWPRCTISLQASATGLYGRAACAAMWAVCVVEAAQVCVLALKPPPAAHVAGIGVVGCTLFPGLCSLPSVSARGLAAALAGTAAVVAAALLPHASQNSTLHRGRRRWMCLATSKLLATVARVGFAIGFLPLLSTLLSVVDCRSVSEVFEVNGALRNHRRRDATPWNHCVASLQLQWSGLAGLHAVAAILMTLLLVATGWRLACVGGNALRLSVASLCCCGPNAGVFPQVFTSFSVRARPGARHSVRPAAQGTRASVLPYAQCRNPASPHHARGWQSGVTMQQAAAFAHTGRQPFGVEVNQPSLTLAGRVSNRRKKAVEYNVYKAYMGRPTGSRSQVIEQFCRGRQDGSSLVFGALDAAAVRDPLFHSASHALVPCSVSTLRVLFAVKFAMAVLAMHSLQLVVGDPWRAVANLLCSAVLAYTHCRGTAFAGRSASIAIGALYFVAVGFSACAFTAGMISAARGDPTLALADALTLQLLVAATASCAVVGALAVCWFSMIDTRVTALSGDCGHWPHTTARRTRGATGTSGKPHANLDSDAMAVADEAFATLRALQADQQRRRVGEDGVQHGHDQTQGDTDVGTVSTGSAGDESASDSAGDESASDEISESR